MTDTSAPADTEGGRIGGHCCTDCALWVTNRDDSDASEDWDRDAVGDTLRAYHVVVGDDRDDFSTVGCDVCGTRDAGERLSVAMWEHA